MNFIFRHYLLSAAGGLLLVAIGCIVAIDRIGGPRGAGGSQSGDEELSSGSSANPAIIGNWPEPTRANFLMRKPFDVGGYSIIAEKMKPWPSGASLDAVSKAWERSAEDAIRELDQALNSGSVPPEASVGLNIMRAACWNFEGNPKQALEVLSQLRSRVESNPTLAKESLYSLVFLQGVTCLRQGETENCVMCRGESSCILPISLAARHLNEAGSRQAIKFFMEYLEQFPDDLEVKWLLNIAHMTLGEHPAGVDKRFLISLDRYNNSEFDLGKFRDVGHVVGLDRFNMQGGGIMEDFDNDGLLDTATTANAPHEAIGFYRNQGDGTFQNQTIKAGLTDQVMGLFCVQTDYDNDGFLDIFVPRGAWLGHPVRPSLLRNNRNGTFTDVTKEAGLETPTNSLTACWADYDNDGFLDLFLPGHTQRNRLYRNLGNGKFEEVAERAGLAEGALEPGMWRCATWIDFDNDRFPDIFVNNLGDTATLFHNNQNGTFTNVTRDMGIAGPQKGFACWAWDFDNDGWSDIFATSYGDPSGRLEVVVQGILGRSHKSLSNKLYRNLAGKGFQDITKEVGLDMSFAAMGCNFGDFDNDGYLDFYLGTGDPGLAVLVPNRMFKNVAGQRFAEITGTSGTGHLQKGHSVACGDWDRNGTVDIFIEMGGVTPIDRYHNILFQNPGQGNNWLNVKLAGSKSNRAAIGARIKVVTGGDSPQTIYRYVSSGSSFGANPLEQMVGLGKAEQVAVLEIYWPTSDTTQVFRDLAANQAIEITEFSKGFKKRPYRPIPLPKEESGKTAAN